MLKNSVLHIVIVLLVLILIQGAWASTRAGRSKCLDSTVQVLVETRFGTTRRVSGYLFSANGQVITSYHAISDANKITIFHTTHGVFNVERIKRIDPRADVAILAIANRDAVALSAARLGDSRLANTGDKVHVMHHTTNGEMVQHDTLITGVGWARQFPGTYLADNYANELMLIEVEGPWDSGSAGGIVCNEAYEVIGLLVGGETTNKHDSKGYALTSSYFSPLLISTYDVAWANLRSDYNSDAEHFDKYFGAAPQPLAYSAPMTEGYIAWFAPITHAQYADYDFTMEINDKIDKNWFYSSGLKVDGDPIQEWSAGRIFVWPATVNPWDTSDSIDQYVHFDADSLFSKRIYKDRDTEERIMTRHILAMALPPGEHTIQYTNKGANYKTSGMKRQKITIEPARIKMLDIEGLSLVTMLLLPDLSVGIGEGEPVRYELERRPMAEKEVNACIRKVRFPVNF